MKARYEVIPFGEGFAIKDKKNGEPFDFFMKEKTAQFESDRMNLEDRRKRYPKVLDNDRGAVLAMLNGQSVRGWSYQNDDERRLKTRLAHEYVEGWFDGLAAGEKP